MGARLDEVRMRAVDVDAGVCSLWGRSSGESCVHGEIPLGDLTIWFPAQSRTLSNLAIASSVIGWTRLTRFPSGSRKRSDRFPHGIVVGVCTH